MNTKVPVELLLIFFLTFSRFEFALKNSAFVKGNEREAKPDWDDFAASLSNAFDKTHSPELTKAVNYFLENPPNKQVLRNGQIMWDTALPYYGLSEIEKVLILIRRVRNNLFHGGKYDLETHEHAERTTFLLKYSLTILEACLALSPKVNDSFNQAKI